MKKPKIKLGGAVDPKRVKSFIERVERLEEERSSIGSDIRDVYAEAKGVGYDVKTMRTVVRLRKIDAADRAEQEALLATYLHALGMAVDLVRDGLSLREAERATGVSKSSIHRALSVPAASQGEPPHDPEAGEIEDEQPAAAIADGEAAVVAIAAPAASGSTEEARQEEVAAGQDAIPDLGVADRSATSPGGSEHRLPALGRSAVVPLGCSTHPQPNVCSTDPKPMKRQDGTVPYRPSNGSEGEMFMARWCDRCKRDADFRAGTGDSCPIAAMTMAVNADHPSYPKEWIRDEGDIFSGRCTAFETAAPAPPTESLGAVAKSEAERVAPPNPDDDLAFPPHLIRVRQRAPLPS